jgi:hypothetical protein
VRAAADVATADLPFELSGIVWFGGPPPMSSEPNGPAPHSIVFAGDSVYMRAFAPSLMRSLSRHAARPQHVHFHVVTNRAGDPRPYLAPSEACPNVIMTASVEGIPVDDTTYFACARFVRAGEIVMRLGRRCVFLDLDSEFVDDPGSHIEGMPEDAVGVFTGHPAGSGFFPWTQIMAGALVLPATSSGISYARLLRASIGYLWAGNQRSRWWIDQAALALATHLTRAYSSTCSIVGLTSRNLRCCDTGAHIKAKCLPSLPEIRNRMENGTPLLQALRQVQSEWRRAEQELATTAGRSQSAG